MEISKVQTKSQKAARNKTEWRKYIIRAINTLVIALLRYSAAFLDWTKEEKQKLDRIEETSTVDNKTVDSTFTQSDWFP